MRDTTYEEDVANGVTPVSEAQASNHDRAPERLLGKAQDYETVINAFMRHVPSLVVVKDTEGRFMEANALAERVYGTARAELLGKTDREALPARIAAESSKLDGTVLSRKTACEVEQTFDWPDGPHTFHTTKFPIFNGGPEPIGIGAIGVDITHHKKVEEGLYRRANFDPTTSLPNRQLIMDRLDQALALSRRTGHATGVLLLDIGDFTSMNEALGHVLADWILMNVASSLRDLCRQADTVGYLNGDKFCILLPNLKDLGELEVVGQKILAALRATRVIGEIEAHIQPSLGTAIFPGDANDSADMLRCAKIALDRAKRQGRNCMVHFNLNMAAPHVRKMKIAQCLRTAIDNDELHLAYQPIVDAKTKRTAGLEALLRWTSPELGNVTPDEFIPVAEETGLINSIGAWVLNTACDTAKQLNGPGDPPLVVSVNLSVRQLAHGDIVEIAAAALERSGLEPQFLKLEMTETVFADNADVFEPALDGLRRLGLTAALDDFGTGYSSLAYLYKYRFSQLKIDRSFVERLTAKDDALLLVSGIIRLAQSLRLDVVAEGLETKEQVDLLSSLGCDKMQGYYFGRPASLADTVGRLKAEAAQWAQRTGPLAAPAA